MEYSVIELQQNNHDGEEVWICDYRFERMDEKAVRNISPTKVFIVQNLINPSARLYHGDATYKVVFKKIGKNGTPVGRPYKLFDNRSWSTPVNIYTTKEECVEKYIDQCDRIRHDISEWIVGCTTKYEKMIELLDKEVDKYSDD